MKDKITAVHAALVKLHKRLKQLAVIIKMCSRIIGMLVAVVFLLEHLNGDLDQLLSLISPAI